MDDVLSDVLAAMRVKGSVYFCDQLESPWGKVFHDPAAASFHQVRRGGCWLETSSTREYLGPGDLLFAGPGVEHTLSSDESGNGRGPSAPPTLLLCGYAQFDTTNDSALQSLFPALCILRQCDIEQNIWLRATLDRLAAEYLSPQPGASIVVRRLTEILMVELIRDNFGRSGAEGFIAALRDPRIAKALQKLHDSPEFAWTLEGLAKASGMSRPSLARRFKSLVGQPMFEYLTELRMQRAKQLLSDTTESLQDIAEKTGYESQVAFAKTFKKRAGVTPTAYRHQAHQSPSAAQ